MAESSQADRYLLDQIAGGNTGAWSQLVARYYGRLLAFARSRAASAGDADDLVQETFLMFLQSFARFRHEASLETYLFTILRRRMIDQYRGRRIANCDISDVYDAGSVEQPLLSPGHSPSWYARRDEQTDLLQQAVAAGLDAMIRRFRDQRKFEELGALEMVFYAQMRNKEVARACNMDEKQVALLKFRAIEQIREHIAAKGAANQLAMLEQFSDRASAADSVLTAAWESLRPTCPKRSTLGRLLLGTLEPQWRQYTEFHVNQLGCRYCRANLDDLKRDSEKSPTDLRQQVFQSTVGFLKQSKNPG